MSARIQAAGLGWRVREGGDPAGPAVVFLHGFSGTGAFWLAIADSLASRRCVMPDLPGHGGTDPSLPPEDWRMARAAVAIGELLDRLHVDRFDLVGYSMGGRLGLHVALRFPQRVARLVLIGASPGLPSEEERRARIASDLDLTLLLERDGIEAFADRWEAQPLFASLRGLPEPVRGAMRAQRVSHDPNGLAACLRAFGTGFQPPLHGELARLTMPVLLVAGENDLKYAAAARAMAERMPDARVEIVAGAGHAVPLERPAELARSLAGFLGLREGAAGREEAAR